MVYYPVVNILGKQFDGNYNEDSFLENKNKVYGLMKLLFFVTQIRYSPKYFKYICNGRISLDM